MGVQMNIKDERAVTLARDLAATLNKSVTEVVREALEEKHRRRVEDIEQRLAEANRLIDDLQQHWDPHTRHLTSKELMDAIYDEDGLPA